MAVAQFIYDTPEKNADLYYATRFRAPDPFIYFKVRGKKFLVMNDLEIDRARRDAQVDTVLSINGYVAMAQKKKRHPGKVDVVHEVMRERGVRDLVVPSGTSFALVDALRKKGYRVESGPSPFCPERMIKTKEEVAAIEKSQRAVFTAMRMARDVLRRSRIKGRTLIYRGALLTSDRLRTMIEVFLRERGYLALDTIVSCGRHAIDPHDTGSGPLRPHESIIVDIFPRSNKTLYYGDSTRTFCKGRAPAKLKEMYAAVLAGQRMGLEMVREGINGKNIHKAIVSLFEERGFPTTVRGGRNVGFFHGTGHGIGLELHEEPVRINQSDFRLKKGYVVSVEPGLYYPEIGGVRIEDLVYVMKRGCKVLGNFPKHLEIR